MSRSYFPLGQASDFPADPEAIGDYAGELSTTGQLILDQVAALKALARGDCWVADTADAFREQAQELAERIEKASDRYVTVGKRLKTLSDDLADYEKKAAEYADEASQLRWTVAANPEVRPQVPPDGGPAEMPPGGDAQNTRRENAERRIGELQEDFDGLVSSAREAAGQAASDVKGAIDDSVKDNWWERNAGWLSGARKVLVVLAALAGFALAVVAIIATAPVWLTVLAVGLAAMALIISLGLAIRADGSWADVAWDAVSLASLGAGAAFAKLAAKAFPAVRSAVAGVRASNAHRGRYALEVPEQLAELRRYASVAVDATGDNLAARQLLAEVATEARSAATAVRTSTLAEFPITRVQAFVDGGQDVSRVARQSREMLLDLRTMPGVADPALIDSARTVVRLSTAGIVATNTGAAANVAQTVRDPSELTGGGGVNIIADLISRLT